jgi:hypothetical protein
MIGPVDGTQGVPPDLPPGSRIRFIPDNKPAKLEPVYVGVLQKESSLLEIFPGRCVPLKQEKPAIIRIGGRFVKVILIPYNELTDEHKAGMMIWLEQNTLGDLPIIKSRIESTGFIAVSCNHFSGIVGAKPKRK